MPGWCRRGCGHWCRWSPCNTKTVSASCGLHCALSGGPGNSRVTSCRWREGQRILPRSTLRAEPIITSRRSDVLPGSVRTDRTTAFPDGPEWRDGRAGPRACRTATGPAAAGSGGTAGRGRWAAGTARRRRRGDELLLPLRGMSSASSTMVTCPGFTFTPRTHGRNPSRRSVTACAPTGREITETGVLRGCSFPSMASSALGGVLAMTPARPDQPSRLQPGHSPVRTSGEN